MSTYETVVVIGMGLWILIALGLLACVVVALRLLSSARKPLRRVAEAAEDLRERLAPAVRNVQRASEDLEYMVGAFRNDADAVGGTVQRAAESTDRIVAMIEERAAEINGLLEVVQEEAEDTFYSTAGLLRGLRVGQRAAEEVDEGEPLRSRSRLG